MKLNMIPVKSIVKLAPVIGVGVFTLLLGSCSRNNPDSPGVEYMPDMYRSPSYEDNSKSAFYADSMTDRPPVKGTVPVGFTPDPFPNTPDGWKDAAEYLKDPWPATADIQEQGKALFNIYCIHCHGTNGMGDGAVAGKLPGPPPPYSGPQLKNITEGEMYQTLEYGKGLMGSHASQLTVDERWKIIRYVQVLQKYGQKDSTQATAGSTPPAAAVADTTKKGK